MAQPKPKQGYKYVIICAILALYIWIFISYPDAMLGWICFGLWMSSEIMCLPPVIAARKRGRLAPGENVVPWAQAFIAASMRAAYFFNCANDFDFSLISGAFIASCSTTYTGLIAVGVATGSQRDRLVMYMWIGVTSALAVQWQKNNVVAGYCYVVVSATMKFSLLAGIPHALKTRDGRYFCDFKMIVFSFTSNCFWIAYAIQLGNLFILLNCVVGILCTTPPLIIKILLHPKLFGDASLYSETESQSEGLDKKQDEEMANGSSSPLKTGGKGGEESKMGESNFHLDEPTTSDFGMPIPAAIVRGVSELVSEVSTAVNTAYFFEVPPSTTPIMQHHLNQQYDHFHNLRGGQDIDMDQYLTRSATPSISRGVSIDRSPIPLSNANLPAYSSPSSTYPNPLSLSTFDNDQVGPSATIGSNPIGFDFNGSYYNGGGGSDFGSNGQNSPLQSSQEPSIMSSTPALTSTPMSILPLEKLEQMFPLTAELVNSINPFKFGSEGVTETNRALDMMGLDFRLDDSSNERGLRDSRELDLNYHSHTLGGILRRRSRGGEGLSGSPQHSFDNRDEGSQSLRSEGSFHSDLGIGDMEAFPRGGPLTPIASDEPVVTSSDEAMERELSSIPGKRLSSGIDRAGNSDDGASESESLLTSSPGKLKLSPPSISPPHTPRSPHTLMNEEEDMTSGGGGGGFSLPFLRRATSQKKYASMNESGSRSPSPTPSASDNHPSSTSSSFDTVKSAVTSSPSLKGIPFLSIPKTSFKKNDSLRAMQYESEADNSGMSSDELLLDPSKRTSSHQNDKTDEGGGSMNLLNLDGDDTFDIGSVTSLNSSEALSSPVSAQNTDHDNNNSSSNLPTRSMTLRAPSGEAPQLAEGISPSPLGQQPEKNEDGQEQLLDFDE